MTARSIWVFAVTYFHALNKIDPQGHMLVHLNPSFYSQATKLHSLLVQISNTITQR